MRQHIMIGNPAYPVLLTYIYCLGGISRFGARPVFYLKKDQNITVISYDIYLSDAGSVIISQSSDPVRIEKQPCHLFMYGAGLSFIHI